MQPMIRFFCAAILAIQIPLQAGWILHEDTEKAFQDFLNDVRDNGIKNIRFDSHDIKQAADASNVTLNNLKASLDQTNKNFKEFSDTNLSNKNNAQTFMRSCAFTTLAVFICCCGTKMIYDACESINAKITAEENENKSLQEILSWRDFVRPTLGIVALGIGYKIISQQ
jgi:hypothetical protein